jgi:hypothetical protein
LTTVTIDQASLTKFAGDFAKQVPYALSLAINNTLVDSQKAEIARVSSGFLIRRASYLKQSIKISPFAKKSSLTGIISVANVGAYPSVFAKFEGNSTKTPFRGSNIAIPTSYTRPNASVVVSQGKRPKNLAKAFVIKGSNGESFLMIRNAKGKYKGLQVAYVLKPSVPITSHRLSFTDTITATINARLQTNWSTAWDKAVATAHP